MNRDYSSWIIGAIFLTGVLVLYASNSYMDLARRQQAYLYHPESHEIYSVELAPLVSGFRKWEPFIPFTRVTYSEPVGAEYLGSVDEILEKANKDRELMKKDFDAWMKESKREFDQSMSELSESSDMVEYADIEYTVRDIDDPVGGLGEPLDELIGKVDLREGEVLAVDAVVIEKRYSLERDQERLPPSITVLREAYLLKGAAAARLYEAGVR